MLDNDRVRFSLCALLQSHFMTMILCSQFSLGSHSQIHHHSQNRFPSFRFSSHWFPLLAPLSSSTTTLEGWKERASLVEEKRFSWLYTKGIQSC
ncbi:hypothetical protein F383_10987 [Gossypium arboreum]|uniref:Uncharacterized protein n=1 Tax=Gossypium arboreum TaxID=29729 RepID=A0A0B0Q040_GOSAR|nr:hypothetical protein F383_10987 [Gossypium arboreum]